MCLPTRLTVDMVMTSGLISVYVHCWSGKTPGNGSVRGICAAVHRMFHFVWLQSASLSHSPSVNKSEENMNHKQAYSTLCLRNVPSRRPALDAQRQCPLD